MDPCLFSPLILLSHFLFSFVSFSLLFSLLLSTVKKETSSSIPALPGLGSSFFCFLFLPLLDSPWCATFPSPSPSPPLPPFPATCRFSFILSDLRVIFDLHFHYLLPFHIFFVCFVLCVSFLHKIRLSYFTSTTRGIPLFLPDLVISWYTKLSLDITTLELFALTTLLCLAPPQDHFPSPREKVQ